MTGVASDSTGAGCLAPALRVGMWDDEEHCRFLRGTSCAMFRGGEIWKGVERSAGSDRQSPGEADPVALSEVRAEGRPHGQEDQAQGLPFSLPGLTPRGGAGSLRPTLYLPRPHPCHSQPAALDDHLCVRP